jgi:hypothetical protein
VVEDNPVAAAEVDWNTAVSEPVRDNGYVIKELSASDGVTVESDPVQV